MNLPNQLTVLRLILTFVFLAVMTLVFPHSKMISLLVFAVAALTDFLDGYLARKHNLITSFGKLMDPLADKILVTVIFVALALFLRNGWVTLLVSLLLLWLSSAMLFAQAHKPFSYFSF